jgi:hypothetical protein
LQSPRPAPQSRRLHLRSPSAIWQPAGCACPRRRRSAHIPRSPRQRRRNRPPHIARAIALK